MAQSTTLETLYERIAENAWDDRFPVKITATGGAVGTFVSTNGAYSSADANSFDGVWIYMLDTSDDAAPKTESRRVTSAGFTGSSGTWAVSPDWSAAPASTDVGLFLYGLHIDQILDAINDVQRECHVPRYLPLSLVTDGDMEKANATVTTDWADAVGTPTQSKETTVCLLRQSLKIVTTTLAHAVTSDNIPVVEGEQLLLSTPIKCTAGSITVQLYDVTNSAVIDSVTVDEAMWAEVRFEATVPSGCQNVAIRYAAATASTTAYVGWCSLLSRERTLIDLPSAITDTSVVEGVYYLPFGYPSEATGSYIALGESPIEWAMGREWRDWRGVTSNRLEVGRVSSYPLFIKFRQVLGTLSDHTDTTPIPEDCVVAGAVAGCFRRLGDEGAYRRWNRDYNVLLDKYDLRKPVIVERSQPRVRVP